MKSLSLRRIVKATTHSAESSLFFLPPPESQFLTRLRLPLLQRLHINPRTRQQLHHRRTHILRNQRIPLMLRQRTLHPYVPLLPLPESQLLDQTNTTLLVCQIHIFHHHILHHCMLPRQINLLGLRTIIHRHRHTTQLGDLLQHLGILHTQRHLVHHIPCIDHAQFPLSLRLLDQRRQIECRGQYHAVRIATRHAKLILHIGRSET
mmetsp:Transcript_27557/g.44735  ORF Transcript_27557/g.44735 Transcript_27557/m.44735 type:complete len:206 (+) Transcript_27557:184-801(+)